MEGHASPLGEYSQGVSESERLPYRLLTGPDDAEFCRRVSSALKEGYVLYGSPAATFNGESVIVAQALVLPAAESASGS
ncbi:DUF1737 domain-containing protein [Leifsonia sp. 2MCAF36]